MFQRVPCIGFAIALAFAGQAWSAAVAAEPSHVTGVANADKQRLIVLSDIGADPDDTESMVRLMLYSSEIDIEGLIATTSCWQPTVVQPDRIRAVIKAYGKVRGNLALNEAGYPQARDLLALVSEGQPKYGMAAVGKGKNSPGSDRIIQVLEEKDNRPLWISAWGGTNTLAQALYKIRHTMTPARANRLIAKLRVYAISDQDDSGIWIRNNFPKLFYIVSPGAYEASTWGAINSVIPGIDNTTISNKWLAEHIQEGHGPLGAAYPDVAYGMEGDTPSFLSLIPNGLNDPEHPNLGGWGGRYELYKPAPYSDASKNSPGGVPYAPETRPIWTNASDTYSPPVKGDYGRATLPDTKSFTGNRVSLWRWRDDFQNDFAARMNWATKPYKEANHPPVPVLATPDVITIKSGEGFGLSARGSYDPDGDSLSYFWFQYPETGTSEPLVKMAANTDGVWITAPKVTKTQTLHFIVRVTDKGTPPLSRYKRITVIVQPK